MRVLASSLLAGLALVLAGCGEGGDGAPASAELISADVAGFVSFNTDFDGEQWQRVARLVEKFPAAEELLQQLRTELSGEELDFERDVKPAVGGEVAFAIAGLDDDAPAIGLVQPKDERRLMELLERSDDPELATRKVQGWTALAESERDLDRFLDTEDGTLADSDVFLEAMEGLAEDASLRVFIRGRELQDAFDQGIAEGDGPPSFTRGLGTLEGVAASVAAEENGVRIQAAFVTEPEIGLDPYETTLAADVPAGALLYTSFGDLGGVFRSVLRQIGRTIPDFDRQRAQIERVVALSLERDIFPLLANEAVVAVYRGTPMPGITFAVAVEDDDKATNVLDRIDAFALFTGDVEPRPFEIDGVEAQELSITGQGFSIFHAVFDGKLVVTTGEPALRAVRADGDKLESDETFKRAAEAADLPDEAVAVVYANLDEGLTFLTDFLRGTGEPLPPEAEANVRPLESALLYAERDGNRLTVSGFLTVE